MDRGIVVKELLRKTGNIEQLASIRKVEYLDGAAEGMRAWQIQNRELYFSVAQDKCMDILELSYRGVHISFLAKNGLTSGVYARKMAYSNKSVMGGMMFTSGTDNVGPGDRERQLPIHGSLRFTPAKHTAENCYFDKEGEYHLQVRGCMEPNGLFEGNIVLDRTIDTVYGTGKICIVDRFRNMGYQREPFLLLYHYNVSYPFLDTCCELELKSAHSVLRERMNENCGESYRRIEEPVDGGSEQVFFHDVCADADGKVRLAIKNPALGMQLRLTYEKNVLPRLVQWKSMVSGDYVLGLEPANCLVFGRKYEEENQTLCWLESGEERSVCMELEICDL